MDIAVAAIQLSQCFDDFIVEVGLRVGFPIATGKEEAYLILPASSVLFYNSSKSILNVRVS